MPRKKDMISSVRMSSVVLPKLSLRKAVQPAAAAAARSPTRKGASAPSFCTGKAMTVTHPPSSSPLPKSAWPRRCRRYTSSGLLMTEPSARLRQRRSESR